MDIYNRITLLLKEKNTTRKSMCSELNISYHTLNSLYKRRTERIPFDLVKQIADYLDVTVDYLVYGEKQEDDNITNLYTSLTVEEKKEVADFIKFVISKRE